MAPFHFTPRQARASRNRPEWERRPSGRRYANGTRGCRTWTRHAIRARSEHARNFGRMGPTVPLAYLAAGLLAFTSMARFADRLVYFPSRVLDGGTPAALQLD